MGNINNDSNKEDNPTLYAIPISEAESNEPTEIIKNDAKENSSVNKEESFSKEKPIYSIQFKMMLVISSVLAITTSAIIALATYFFKSDNKVRILETNLELVRVVELKVRADLNSVVDKGKQLALTLKQDFKYKQQK
jgi:hypothetical protein